MTGHLPISIFLNFCQVVEMVKEESLVEEAMQEGLHVLSDLHVIYLVVTPKTVSEYRQLIDTGCHPKSLTSGYAYQRLQRLLSSRAHDEETQHAQAVALEPAAVVQTARSGVRLAICTSRISPGAVKSQFASASALALDTE